MLRRLGLQLARRRDIRHERDVDRDAVAAPQIVAELADRFDERQRFDVADGAADFAKDEVEIVDFVERECLYRIGDMRDHLNRRAEIITAPFAGDDLLVDAARGDIIRLPRGDAGEAFVMTEVEIGFRAVIGDIDFAVLVRRHRAGIDVEVRVELADANAVSARLQQCRKRCRHQPFAKRGNHAAGDKNKPRHGRMRLDPGNPARQGRESGFVDLVAVSGGRSRRRGCRDRRRCDGRWLGCNRLRRGRAALDHRLRCGSKRDGGLG